MVKKKTKNPKRPVESYEHTDKQRVNNPPVGLVTPETDPDAGQKRAYAYDPHLDPQLQWAGKAEHTSFEVPTVSLHVHERIEPRTILEAVRKRNGEAARQPSLFEMEERPLREAIEFYKHKDGWTNRLIAGDSLLVMNSLLEKEGMAGKVQMIYIDPPYGIKYGSNFQPFVNKRDVKDGKDEDLTQEPEMIRAFRDTWELGIHSYLTYLRDRLLLTRELLTESGSIFVQISDENVHRVRQLMDEVFGANNFCSLIAYSTTGGFASEALSRAGDYIVWYARHKDVMKYRPVYVDKPTAVEELGEYDQLELADGTRRAMTTAEKTGEQAIPVGARVFTDDNPTSQGAGAATVNFEYEGQVFHPGESNHWKAPVPDGMNRLAWAKRFMITPKGKLRYIRFLTDFGFKAVTNIWTDIAGAVQDRSDRKVYIVQTSKKIVSRCLHLTTDPGDLVFDPTCGSGTTAYVAEQWGRRWITCDTSRVALTLARQRLMTAVFDYYELAHPHEGVGSGFRYKTVPHVTLKSIANNPDLREGMTREQIDAAIARHADQETLYDQPFVDKKRTRVSGPFTVEAVPAPAVKSVEETLTPALSQGEREFDADASIARSGETLRQGEWRDELLRTGIRGKAGQYIRFSRLEPLPGCRWLHADGETRPSDEGADRVRETPTAYAPQRVVVSFGAEHAPLEQRHVARAIEEAQTLVPRPKLLIFAAFQFDPEAAKDIDETNWPGITLLKAQMNADLLTDDLKKKRASNESFWLIGQPDVRLERIAPSPQPSPSGRGSKGGGVQWRVVVEGFDYYNTKTGGIESGGADRIAVWLLDTDYDGRSLFPRQVFFPMAGDNEGWAKLARNLKAEVDEERIEAYRGTQSLPFEAGERRRVAVKIVDDRGVESLKVLDLPE